MLFLWEMGDYYGQTIETNNVIFLHCGTISTILVINLLWYRVLRGIGKFCMANSQKKIALLCRAKLNLADDIELM